VLVNSTFQSFEHFFADEHRIVDMDECRALLQSIEKEHAANAALERLLDVAKK
jgi:hypothetical protein